MTKVTLDMNTFKALASDTRLDILKALDGKRMSLNDISRATKLNKATLHEHLAKLNEAGLVKKKEREGHKWVYYKLTWKGEGLLHPENTRIVVLFSVSFISVFLAVVLITSFMQPITIGMAQTIGDTTYLYGLEDEIDTFSVELLMSYHGDAKNEAIPTQVEKRFTSKGIETFAYLGSINATSQSVEDITIFFQSNANMQNSIGQVYDVDEIGWKTSTNGRSRSVSPSELLLYNWSNVYCGIAFGLDSNNESEEKNETDENTTNDTLAGSYGEDFSGVSPAIPEMIATVQDPTFLYFAAVFITVFGALFTLSAWRLRKSRKPIL